MINRDRPDNAKPQAPPHPHPTPAHPPPTSTYNLYSCNLNNNNIYNYDNISIYVGTQSLNGPHVSFSIKPNDTVEIEQHSPLEIIWQIQDTQCQPNGWRAEVGVRSETLLLYPRANQSEPNENYSSYSVAATRGECEEGPVQKVNITFTVFISEPDIVNFTEYIFCEIFIPNTNTIRSEVCLFLISSTTATVPEITTTASSSLTSNTSIVNVTKEIVSTMSSQSRGQSINYITQVHYLLLVCALLVLSLLSVQ